MTKFSTILRNEYKGSRLQDIQKTKFKLYNLGMLVIVQCSAESGKSECINPIPVYSGKHIVREDLEIFCSNKSFLLRNRMIEVSVNHLLLQIESNNFIDSCMRFCEQWRI